MNELPGRKSFEQALEDYEAHFVGSIKELEMLRKKIKRVERTIVLVRVMVLVIVLPITILIIWAVFR